MKKVKKQEESYTLAEYREIARNIDSAYKQAMSLKKSAYQKKLEKIFISTP